MTKRAILIGLTMAAIVLAVVFIVYRPQTSQAPAQETPVTNSANSNDSTSTVKTDNGDTTSDIEAELNASDSDFNDVNSSDFDPDSVE